MRTRSSGKHPRLALALALAFLATGCGGGGPDGPPATSGTGPAPSPTPSPAPSPSPSPTPAPGPSIAGAKPGESIAGPLACSDGVVTRSPDGSVTGIQQISKTKIDNGLVLAYRAPDSFASDVNGFGGSQWTPEDKRTAPNEYFTRYASPAQGELQLGVHNLIFVTYGLENSSGLCFFAAGLEPQSLPPGKVVYTGTIDGFAVISGHQQRLFSMQESAPVLTMDFSTGRGKLEFQLVGRDDPFGDFEKAPGAALGTVSAELQLSPGSKGFGLTALSGSGFDGRVTGQFVDRDQSILGTGGAGVALVFELTRPNGDILYGSIALGALLI